MASVNKVILVGHLGKDPEIRSFQSGGRVANFSVATSEKWKDKTSGEKKERTEWHNVKILNDALVSIAENYLRKGSKVYIEGSLETEKWKDEKTGVDKYSTKVTLRPYNGSIVLLDSKKSDSDNEDHPVKEGDDLDDEIPF